MKKLIAGVVTVAIAVVGFAGTATKAEQEYTKELVMVQSVTDDGEFLNAMPIDENSQLEYGYILDNKYKLGDIVEITYNNDDLINQRKLEGKELANVEDKYAGAIDCLMDEGIEMDINYVQAK